MAFTLPVGLDVATFNEEPKGRIEEGHHVAVTVEMIARGRPIPDAARMMQVQLSSFIAAKGKLFGKFPKTRHVTGNKTFIDIQAVGTTRRSWTSADALKKAIREALVETGEFELDHSDWEILTPSIGNLQILPRVRAISPDAALEDDGVLAALPDATRVARDDVSEATGKAAEAVSGVVASGVSGTVSGVAKGVGTKGMVALAFVLIVVIAGLAAFYYTKARAIGAVAS